MSERRPVYTIGSVARMVGVPAATIRTWEERYGVVHPQRTAGGHRLYSRDQVEQIRFVANQIERGVQPGPAHQLLEDGLARGAQRLALGRSPEARLLIMLAERDPYAAELSDYFLRTEGYDVELVFDAAEAERSFDALSPDLVVVELLISGDGFALTRHLKARSDVRILAISPLDARDEAFAAGADAFLVKPLDPLGLISMVKDLLGASAFLRGGSPTDQLTT